MRAQAEPFRRYLDPCSCFLWKSLDNAADPALENVLNHNGWNTVAFDNLDNIDLSWWTFNAI